MKDEGKNGEKKCGKVASLVFQWRNSFLITISTHKNFSEPYLAMGLNQKTSIIDA